VIYRDWMKAAEERWEKVLEPYTYQNALGDAVVFVPAATLAHLFGALLTEHAAKLVERNQ